MTYFYIKVTFANNQVIKPHCAKYGPYAQIEKKKPLTLYLVVQELSLWSFKMSYQI